MPLVASTPSLPVEMQTRTLEKIPLSETEVRAKVSYANTLFIMEPAKRIFSSGHVQAIGLLEQARNKASAAQIAFDQGELSKADALVNQCYRSVALATALFPSQYQLKKEEARHAKVLEGLKHAVQLHQDAFERQVIPSRRIEFDAEAVSLLELQAEQATDKGDFLQANHSLEQARMLVDLATMAMLDKQTVIYAVDVSTPEKEFVYEVGRYHSYAELIPAAIEMNKPSKMLLMLVNRKLDAGEWKLEQAKLTADAEDYPRAIRMVMDASVDIRKALKLMKVKVYE